MSCLSATAAPPSAVEPSERRALAVCGDPAAETIGTTQQITKAAKSRYPLIYASSLAGSQGFEVFDKISFLCRGKAQRQHVVIVIVIHDREQIRGAAIVEVRRVLPDTAQ